MLNGLFFFLLATPDGCSRDGFAVLLRKLNTYVSISVVSGNVKAISGNSRHSCKTGRETKRMVEESCSEYCQLRKSSICRQANPPYAVHGSKEWALYRTPRSIRKRFPVSGTKVPDKPIPADNKWPSQCSWIWSTEHIQGPEARRPCSRCCSLVLGRLKLSRRSRLMLVPQTVTQVMRGIILSVRTSAGAMILLYNTHMQHAAPEAEAPWITDTQHPVCGWI